MQCEHAPAAVSAVFDGPDLVSAAGLVRKLGLARVAGLDELARPGGVSVPADRGANVGGKVMALVAGKLAGADSIDDMNVLRHGGMGRLFDRTYTPSMLGAFLREFRFGHVRQLDVVASRTLVALGSTAPLLHTSPHERVMVDLDDAIIEVHGYQKQGASFRYSGVSGLNASLTTASTTSSAPVLLGQRLRQGKTGSPNGTTRIIGDALATLRRRNIVSDVRPLLRADSAFYGHATVGTAIKAGADVSVIVRMDPAVKAVIASIPDDGWETIECTDAIRDETTGRWISKAEVTEVPFTAFRSRKITERVAARLVVRRFPDLNPNKVEQPTLFDVYRHHALFTTTDKTTTGAVTTDKTHRAHAIIEQVHADLKSGPLAHLPSGVFTANSAWLVLAVIAFNLTRAAGLIADRPGRLARATTATIRHTLISARARLARSARRVTPHLPEARPWQTAFERLFTATHAPPPAAVSRPPPRRRHDQGSSGRPG